MKVIDSRTDKILKIIKKFGSNPSYGTTLALEDILTIIPNVYYIHFFDENMDKSDTLGNWRNTKYIRIFFKDGTDRVFHM